MGLFLFDKRRRVRDHMDSEERLLKEIDEFVRNVEELEEECFEIRYPDGRAILLCP
ncbi:MAG: hypothetical protein ACP5HD_01540 [Thermoproteus sp.]